MEEYLKNPSRKVVTRDGLMYIELKASWDAEKEARRNGGETAIATVKIEWEE